MNWKWSLPPEPSPSAFLISMLEPVREKLQAGFQSDTLEVDVVWANRFKDNLMASKVDILVELGRAEISSKDVVDLQKGDVILLDQFAVDPLKIYVEGMLKFGGCPGIFKGNQAVKLVELYEKKEVHQYGAE